MIHCHTVDCDDHQLRRLQQSRAEHHLEWSPAKMIAKLYLVETKDDEMRSFGFPVRQFSRQRREILRRYIL